MLKLQRIEANGLLQLDKAGEAFEVCLAIFRADPTLVKLQEINADYDATTASWLKAETAEIWRRASSDEQQKISAQLAEIKQELFDATENSLEADYIASFGAIPGVMEAAASGIAQQELMDQHILAAQQWLLDFAHGSSRPLNREATATLSKILHDTNFKHLARPFDLALSGPLADAICLDGMTGRQCLEAWVESAVTQHKPWPYGKVEVEGPITGTSKALQNVNARAPLVEIHLEHGDDLLRKCNIFYSSRVGELLIRDSLGKEVTRQTLGEEERQGMHGGFYGVTRGNLLIVSLGQIIVAIDTLAPHAENGESVLWRKRILRNPGNRAIYGGYNFRPQITRAGSSGTPRAQLEGRWIGVLGPVNRDSFVYQDQQGLVCVDPMSGETLWSRTDAPNACNLFGDDQVVIAVEDASTIAHVYNVLDGRSLGEVKIPPWSDHLTTRGTNLISWTRTANGRYELTSLEAVSGKTNWKKDFPTGSQVDVTRGKYIAIADPTGQYTIVDVDDGQVLVNYASGSQCASRKGLPRCWN